ncbi:uncharacterized protein C1orf131 homolog isoform X2 [Rhineura floridana]|uniref:uncharacterized protein C1orf131 homolog isoform X2 n=1 Tax=Rhineura floridana TaxID=261503 RepID=UPI002AC87E14|nr:uncharacterized protein C1orf131 homolog isoform X2 [Rhineura floridana]
MSEDEDSSMARSPAGRHGLEEREEDARKSFASASCLLDTVLSSLYDFGESLLDRNEKKKSKKRKSSEKLILTASNTLSEDRNVASESGAVAPVKKKSASSFFDSLKDGSVYNFLNQKRALPKSSPLDAEPPKSARQGNKTEIEVVTFHGQRRKRKAKCEIAEDSGSKAEMSVQESHSDGQGFNLEKARLEVHQFGIAGFEKKEQRVLEQERAIMLGAKPPKKQYLNYKILQQKIKETKAAKKEDNVMENKSDSLKRQKKKGYKESNSRRGGACDPGALYYLCRKSKKKTKQSILPTGQVGTFKNGTLILRSSDIKKIKSSKVIK